MKLCEHCKQEKEELVEDNICAECMIELIAPLDEPFRKESNRKKKKEFEMLKDNATYLWQIQKEKAKKADQLLKDCESIEAELNKTIDNMKNFFPELFENWLEEFKLKIDKEEL